MRKSSWIPIVAIPLVIIIAFIVGRWGYYGGSAQAYTAPDRPLEEVKFNVGARSERLEAVDNPTVSEGVVVVDYAHSNAFFIEELNSLLSRIVARGFSYDILTDPKAEGAKDTEGLAEKLRDAKALILAAPRLEYTPEEITEIERFVNRGGRLFIVGDPTRTVVVEALNSVAGSFGIIFPNDYLYSLENNDSNYRNVIYTNFVDSPITAGLDDGKVIFYGGGSINAPGSEIILGDATTQSSTSEGGRVTAAAALTTNGQVLALGDITFFTEPYSAAENNGILINNIADFLTGGQPQFKITDFPVYFRNEIDIVFDNPLVFNSQFDDAAKLKDFLEQQKHTVNFVNEIGTENDVIFIGRYDNTEAIDSILAAGNISILDPINDPVDNTTEEAAPAEETANTETTDKAASTKVNNTTTGDGIEDRFIEGRVKIKGIGDLERGGSTLFYLHQDGERNILVVLSDNADTNADAFDILIDNKLLECQASPQIAVCQTEKPDEELPPSVRSNRIDKILVVSDDDGRKRADGQTSVLDYTDAFSQTSYKVDTWETTEQGSPDLDTLLEYDALIWTTGDYWDDSIGQEDVQLLTEYIGVGGNLIMSGASIAFDWDHTDFVTNIAHADYLNFSQVSSIEVALDDHTISRDFEDIPVIEFLETPSEEELFTDVVNHTPNSRVIFRRAPGGDDEGAPAVIAYEDDRSKIAYYVFPLYLMPPAERTLLVNNTVDWFTKKVLDLPDEKDYVPFKSDIVNDNTGNDETTGDETTNDNSDSGGGDGSGNDEGNNNDGGNDGGGNDGGNDGGGNDGGNDGGGGS